MEPAPAWDSLRLLDGDWRGFGTGGFPTIESFEYREHLRIRMVEGQEVLHYLQSTWRIDGDEEHASHIETGFISLTQDDEVILLNAQGSDRVESLRGLLEVSVGDFVLVLSSTEFLNDERMLSSWRRLRCTDDQLHYTMGMATTGARDGELHLTAELHRTGS